MRRALKNHSEVAHIWASQSQAEGRAGHMFFEGDTIYSYGRHFAIARFVPMTRAGEAVVLFNSARYSNSTSKHQSLTRRALTGRNVRVFDVPSLGVDTLDHDANARYYLGKIEEARGSASRAITAVAYWHDVMRDYILEAYRYAETFPIKDRKARAAIKAFKVMRERGALFTPEESAKMQARTRAAAGARSY